MLISSLPCETTVFNIRVCNLVIQCNKLVKFALEQAVKAQRGSRSTGLVFL